jgi:hypothetical protein
MQDTNVVTKIVYFDRNVFDRIRRQMFVSDAIYLTLRNAIQTGRIAIPLSVVLLEETLPVLKTTPFKIEAERQILEGLAAWQILIKFHAHLLTEDIISYAQGKPLAPRFVKFSMVPEQFFNSSTERLQVIEDTKKQKQDGWLSMRKVKKMFIDKFKTLPSVTFEEFWNIVAIPIIEGKATELGVLEQCKERGLNRLLELRSVKLFVGFYVSYFYIKFIKGEKLLLSDSRDHHHAVSASVADIFVTQDSGFGRLLKQIPVEDFEILDLEALIVRLRFGEL